jgi:hypothetical protein
MPLAVKTPRATMAPGWSLTAVSWKCSVPLVGEAEAIAGATTRPASPTRLPNKTRFILSPFGCALLNLQPRPATLRPPAPTRSLTAPFSHCNIQITPLFDPRRRSNAPICPHGGLLGSGFSRLGRPTEDPTYLCLRPRCCPPPVCRAVARWRAYQTGARGPQAADGRDRGLHAGLIPHTLITPG